MYRQRLILMAVAVVAALVCTGAAAFAAPDPIAQAPEGSSEIEFGEGIPDGIPPAILREQETALRRSEAGRAWLRTSEGKAHAADVSRYLRRKRIGLRSMAAEPAPTILDPGGGCSYDCYNSPDDGVSDIEGGGADGYAYFSGCKNPYVVHKYRNVIGHILWRYYQQLYFCWHNGGLTYLYRTRWAWISDHWLNGWGFKGHVGTNCYSETCYDHWIGWPSARVWTQGAFEVCRLKWIGCKQKLPMSGMDINAWGGWWGWIG